MSQNEQFALLEAEMSGRRLIANINLSLRTFTDKYRFPWFLSLSTTLKESDQDGLATKTEADALDSWEDQIESAIASDGDFKFIGRVTWNGHRELLYHLREPEATVSALQRLIDAGETRPFAFRCERDEAWSHVADYLAA